MFIPENLSCVLCRQIEYWNGKIHEFCAFSMVHQIHTHTHKWKKKIQIKIYGWINAVLEYSGWKSVVEKRSTHTTKTTDAICCGNGINNIHIVTMGFDITLQISYNAWFFFLFERFFFVVLSKRSFFNSSSSGVAKNKNKKKRWMKKCTIERLS